MERRETMPEADVVLIGGGVMSATLGVILHQLEPTSKIQIIESLAEVAKESSNPWNNAGTGHAALCELNYTAAQPDGTVDISKALKINESFELSKQFWSYLTRKEILPEPEAFIRPVPHMSFVWGGENVDYLRRRYETMKEHHFFREMEFSDDPEVIRKWAPLLLEGRDLSQPLAATRVASGTDVNFGSLTESLVKYLDSQEMIKLATNHIVRDLERTDDGKWKVKVYNKSRKLNRDVIAPFVFVGAGGASLPLLQKSGIEEGKGYGGFPVSGQFLVCDNQEVVKQHQAKVYGKAAVGAPPMSVPHLDTRVIDGKKSLLFGPFAGFSPKFLKTGSLMDLPGSVKLDNLVPMLAVGKNNMDLTKYLIEQVMMRPQDRVDALREFFPVAKDQNWRLVTAGQRVQIIKEDPDKGGVLQFGTEVVSSSDGSLAALLGASPGASTAVAVMLEVLQKCFPDRLEGWESGLREMIPSYQNSLDQDEESYSAIRALVDTDLKLG